MEDRFKEKCTIEQRINESARIKAKYPERVPVIVERADGCKNIEEITKHKYLVPNDLTIGQLAYVIRKKIPKLESHIGMFMFVNNEMPCNGDMIEIIYNKHVDEDGFLYVEYSGENTFGYTH
jgi:GABA(A) receptor-associated protein